jgi:hypothetical protein
VFTGEYDFSVKEIEVFAITLWINLPWLLFHFHLIPHHLLKLDWK